MSRADGLTEATATEARPMAVRTVRNCIVDIIS